MKKYAAMSAAVLAAMAGLGASAFAQCPGFEIGSTPNAAELGEVDIGQACDDCTAPVSLPFAVSLYGNAYTSLIASSNGNLQFGSNSASLGNVCTLPTATFTGGPTIMAHWDDLRTDQLGGSGRGIFTSESGVPGARRFNIEYRASLYRDNTQNVNFIISFYENQSYFDIFYIDIAQDGFSATAAVQANGTAGSAQTTLSCNAANLTSGTSYRFFCPATFNPTVVLTTDLGAGIVGTSFIASAAVTGGQPASPITGVSLNASAIDAGSITMLDNGVAPDGVANDGIYSAAVTVGNNAPFGAQTLTATATDALGRTGSGNRTFTVSAGNDECVGAIQIFDGSNPANNLDAATTTPGCTGSNDVWFRYVATTSGSLEASTCGARTFDTTIAIWDGCPENGGVQIACNDDFCGLGSTVTWQGVQGQTYYVRFAGFGGQRGTADLTIGVPGPTDIDAFGFATPDPVFVGDSSLLQVFVTPGENPTSTGLAVTIDTSSLQGGSSTQTMYDDGTNGDEFAGDNIFSFLQPIALEQAEQTYQFGYIVTDNEARSFNGDIFLDVEVSNPDALFATFTPNTGFAGTVALYEVVVTPAVNPDSTGIVVTADFSSLMGSSTQQLFDDGTNGDQFAGDGTFSYAITIDNTLAAGAYPVNVVSVTDDQGRTDDFLPGATFTVRVAAQWEELGEGRSDAGDLPSTGQTPTGTDPFNALGGNIESSSDADMFLINICDAANFGATTVGNGTFGDTQLFLFDSAGLGITSNDDSQGTAQSTITSAFIPGTGNYYLAVSRYNLDPVEETGALIWNNTPFGTERQPDGPGAGGAIAGWTGTFASTGDYQVTFAGTCFATGGPDCNYDFNQDENVDLLDAQQMAQVFVGLISPEANWLDGDLNGDENADLTDAQILAAFVVSGQCNL
jgi:hypothetical protein